jgi:glutamyl-tRNA reductase
VNHLRSIGISHHTAAVEVRERMWLSVDETREAIEKLTKRFFNECILISTCNRTELYGLTPEPDADDAEVKKFLIDFKRAGDMVKPEHFRGGLAKDAVSHLFQVAAGVDSMVVGDIQILNQVKEAFQISREMNALGPVTNRLMQSTMHVGKRVRTETAICEGAVSVSYAAVELANKIFADLSKKSVLLIGAGETGELTLKHLAGRGIGSIQVANRTREKAEALVSQFGGSVVEYADMLNGLRTVDIVVTSVQSPSYIVQPGDVQKVMKERSNNPLFVIDIGVPRNVNPAAKKIDNVFLYDMDSLHAIVDKNLDKRMEEVPKVQRIIEEELADFLQWHNSLQVGPTIHDLRDALEAIRAGEVEKNINRFKPEDRELVDIITKRIINKVLHQPVTSLKAGAENGNMGRETMLRINALRELFGIGKDRNHADE